MPVRYFISWSFKEAITVDALRACIYIYIRQLSSFGAATLWFIDLFVAYVPDLNTLLSLFHFFPRRTRTKHENTRSLLFSYGMEMAANGYWARKVLRERDSLNETAAD